jgi:transcriptional regulator with XRE-family HTH domain
MINGEDDSLSVAQIRCIEMLIEGYKMEDIVNEVGYSRTQIWRWKKEKNFIAEWEKRKLEISEFLDRSSKKKFEKLQDTAIEVLENLLKTSNNDNVKKETAQYIIERNIGKIPNKTEIKDTTGDTDNDGNVIDSIPDWEQGNKE